MSIQVHEGKLMAKLRQEVSVVRIRRVVLAQVLGVLLIQIICYNVHLNSISMLALQTWTALPSNLLYVIIQNLFLDSCAFFSPSLV